MKGVSIFDINFGSGYALNCHSQKWFVDLPNGRYHVESLRIKNTPPKIIVTPCDKSCSTRQIPDDVWNEVVSQFSNILLFFQPPRTA